MTDILREVEKPALKTGLPDFAPGDAVRVHVKVREGEKERIQVFAGVVIARRGGGVRETFTVRKISSGIGVERDLSAPFARRRPHRDRAKRLGPARQALLPARPQGEGRAHRRETDRVTFATSVGGDSRSPGRALRGARAAPAPGSRREGAAPARVQARGRGGRGGARVSRRPRRGGGGHSSRGLRPAGSRRLEASRRAAAERLGGSPPAGPRGRSRGRQRGHRRPRHPAGEPRGHENRDREF